MSAIESLCNTLLDMGEQQTNPVLQILNGSEHIERDVKYPKDLLRFNQTQWRAYYHCHSNDNDIQHLFNEEHGHFHIFAPIDKTNSWSHLVALSIDSMGQPLRWFMVNHWVCGETWLDADSLQQSMENIPFAKQTTVIEKWLLSMVAVFQTEITSLLNKRDNIVNNNDQFKKNKSYYLLAEQKVNLQNKLESLNLLAQ